MGLASDLTPSRSALSGGMATTGGVGNATAAMGRGGGGSASVKDCFLLRKKDDVFFCRVCVVVWWDSRDGGAEDLEWDRLTVVSTDVEDGCGDGDA